jgi:peptidoglycan hydrolase-like protein with peptidoglycan-binding domain
MPPPVNGSSNAPSVRRAVATPAVNVNEPAPPLTNDPDSFDGTKVKKAEQLLRKLGLHPGVVDRQYTANTERSVRTFQSAAGLDPTGALDVRTMNAMRRAASRKDDGVQTAGQQSASIVKQERRLKRLGYDVGIVDGLYDQKTANAVEAFKKDQGVDANGMLGKRGRDILETENQRLNHDPRRIRRRPSERRERLDRRVATAAAREHADGTKGFGRGSNGLSIKVVQGHLKAAGFDPKHANGRFDERTEGMVKQFQARSGLEPTGRVDTRTWNKLKKATLEARTNADPKQMIGERSGAVKEVERKLKKLGFNTGPVDGLYTAQTERAVDAFRRRHDMGTFDGVGPGTLREIRKEYKRKLQPNLNTVKGCAQFLLNSPNVGFWTPLSGTNGRGERTNLERLARGDSAIVRTPDDGPGDRFIKPNIRVMKALVAMAKAGPVTINALTGGDHSTTSNHYRGTAVDLSIHTGNAANLVRIANRFGGVRNHETTHIHLDF